MHLDKQQDWARRCAGAPHFLLWALSLKSNSMIVLQKKKKLVTKQEQGHNVASARVRTVNVFDWCSLCCTLTCYQFATCSLEIRVRTRKRISNNRLKWAYCLWKCWRQTVNQYLSRASGIRGWTPNLCLTVPAHSAVGWIRLGSNKCF